MLLWAYAFFDLRNEHEWHGFYRSIENQTERLRLFPKQTGKGTAYQQTEPEWDWERENQSQQGNEAYAPALSGLLLMHTAFYCTQLAQKNMNPKNLQYIMGHASITITLDLYAHASEAGANRELKSLVAWFTTICTTFASRNIRDWVQFHGRPARRKNRQTLINRDILTVRDSYKKILKNLYCFYRKRTMCKMCLYGILEKRHSLYKNGENIMRKRFLSILFALCIMLCLVPVTVFAE